MNPGTVAVLVVALIDFIALGLFFHRRYRESQQERGSITFFRIIPGAHRPFDVETKKLGDIKIDATKSKKNWG